MHLARHGEAQNKFEEVLKQLLSQLSTETLLSTTTPTWKSLNDRFKKIITDHRTTRRVNETASGTVEIRGELEELLDNIILAVEKKKKERRSEREECTEMDRPLQEAG